MSEQPFDTFAHRAAATLTRRSTLLTLGGAALTAAVTAPARGAASEAGKKARNKARKMCKRQQGQCAHFWADRCSGTEGCNTLIDVCCPFLGSCQNAAFWDCVFALPGG